MSGPVAPAEIDEFLRREVVELTEARSKAFSFHHADDIRAAGNEVEQKVRDVLARRLPAACALGQGHIVDVTLRRSPQIDIVVFDASHTPLVAKGLDGTVFVPFESVYAVGEVKSTYEFSKHQVEAFVTTLDKVRTGLSHERAPPNMISHNFGMGAGLSTGEKRPYKNPLFSFMFFVDSGDFKVEQIAELYRSRPRGELPNVICLLDRGLVLAAHVKGKEPSALELGPLTVQPEFVPLEDKNQRLQWIHITPGEENQRGPATFGLFLALLVGHLNSVLLFRPDLVRYFQVMFKTSSGLAIALAR